MSSILKRNLNFLILFFILLSTQLRGQDYPTDFFPTEQLSRILIKESLKGSPSSFTIRSRELMKDSADLSLSPIIEQYHVQNNRIDRVEFEIKRKIIKQFTFDSLSRILSFFDFQDEAKTPWIYYNYDSNDRSKEEVCLRNDSTIYAKTVLNFNEKNQLISRIEYWGENKIKSARSIDYNESNDPVDDTYTENQNQSVNHYDYLYDNVGRKEKKLTYNSNRLQSRVLYEYRQDSIISQQMDYGFNQKPKSQFLIIEKDSMRVEVTGYFAGGDTTSYRSSFKQIFIDQDLVEYESRTFKGTFVDRYKTFYEFDNRGNWIKKMTYLNNKLIKIQDRLFRY